MKRTKEALQFRDKMACSLIELTPFEANRLYRALYHLINSLTVEESEAWDTLTDEDKKRIVDNLIYRPHRVTLHRYDSIRDLAIQVLVA